MKKITLLILLICEIYIGNAQNTCATALSITAGTQTVTAVDGTDIPTPLCAQNGGSATAAEWFIYTPTQNYTVTVTSDLAVNACKDTRLHIYTGTSGALACLIGDDDGGIIACPGNSNTYLSKATFDVFPGNTYYIAFDNKWSSSGFDFQLIEDPYVTPVVSFTPAIITSTSSICNVTDMNGDYLDDIVTVGTNQMTVLTQQVAGSFVSTTYPLPGLTANPSWSIASGDFDKNGYNDLVFGSASRVAVIKANSTGTGYTEIPYPENIFTQRTNFIDINNDGHLDLFACHDVDQSHAYRNDGAGNLVFDISLFPTLDVGGNYASIWSDYDNDGDQDMYLAKCRGGAPAGDPQRINLLYKNNGNGTFTESGAAAGVNDGAQSWSTAIEDFDSDGDMDFLVSNISDQNRFYKNNGDGTFTDIYASTGINAQVGSWEIQAADFNNDGLTDFLWQNSKELYINNGNLTFTGYDVPFSEGGIGDLNNDGFLDIQFGNKVYYNAPNANNWIKIKLQGIQSNSNGIGARIEIYGAFGKQIREVRSGHGFAHQSSMNVHFGIGAATDITKIIVRWPSGMIDIINNPTVNQSKLVVEGATLSIDEFKNSEFNIFPNPTTENLKITLKSGNDIKLVQVYNLLGKLVLQSNLESETLNVSGLSNGTYILLLRDFDGKDYAQKFIKK